MTEQRTRLIASVSKAFTALTLVAEGPQPVTAKRLAALMDSPLPTTYHLLNTLVAEGALVRTPDRGYQLGPRVASLGRVALDQHDQLAQLEPALSTLAAETGESAYLSAWRNGEIEVVLTAEGSRAVRVTQLHQGAHGHAHARASGKVLLAFSDQEQRERYLEGHTRDQLTPKTLTDLAVLEKEFVSVRRAGYAIDDEEFETEVSCVAAPIMNADRIVGTFTVSAPTSRFKRTRDELVRATVAACHRAEELLPGF